MTSEQSTQSVGLRALSSELILETARLTLWELTLSDSPFIIELLNSRGFLDNIGDRGIRTRSDAAAYIDRVRASYTSNGFGLWRCQLKSDQTSVGICGFVRRAGLDYPDIGYAFLEAHWGLGYATESSRACMGYARAVIDLPTILAVTTHANLASISVLKKIGMRDAGSIVLPGSERESALFIT